MVKEKVLSFYVVFFLFVLAIALMHFWLIGGMTGFVVSETGVYSSEEGNESDVVISDFQYKREGVYFVGSYSLEEKFGRDRELLTEYVLTDGFGREVISGRSSASLGAYSIQSFSFWEELPKDSSGEYTFSLSVSEDNRVYTESYSVFLPKSGLTGMAISEENKSVIQFVLLGVVLVAFAIWLFYSLFRKGKAPVGENRSKDLKGFGNRLIPIKAEEIERERNV